MVTKTEVALLSTYICTLVVMAWVLIAIFTPIEMPPRWLSLTSAFACGYLFVRFTFDLLDRSRLHVHRR
jgi:hypothetical protein